MFFLDVFIDDTHSIITLRAYNENISLLYHIEWHLRCGFFIASKNLPHYTLSTLINTAPIYDNP